MVNELSIYERRNQAFINFEKLWKRQGNRDKIIGIKN